MSAGDVIEDPAEFAWRINGPADQAGQALTPRVRTELRRMAARRAD